MGKAGKRKFKKFLSFGLALIMAVSGVDMTTLTALAASETVSSGDPAAYVEEVPESLGTSASVSAADIADVSEADATDEPGDDAEKASEAESMPAAEEDGERVAYTATTHGDWTIEYDSTATEYKATFGTTGFVYHSPGAEDNSKAVIDAVGSYNGKYAVKSNNINGANSKGVVAKTGSYADYTAPCAGTLTVYVGSVVGKSCFVSTASAALGNFATASDKTISTYPEGNVVSVAAAGNWYVVDVEVEAGTTYYITVSDSKMVCYGAEFVPYTNLSGSITGVSGLSGLKFVSKTTAIETAAALDGASYSVTLKPGEYTLAITGADASNYGISSSSRTVTVEASTTASPKEQTHNITVQEATTYTVEGTISGVETLPGDLSFVFVPEDTTSYEEVTASVEGLSYSALLMANVEYTLELKGAKDYRLDGTITVTGDGSASVTKNVSLIAVDKYAVSGKFLGLGETRGDYIELSTVTPSKITFTNVDDGYVYMGTASAGSYTVSLRDGAYVASITASGYSTSTHVTVDGAEVSRDLLLKDTSTPSVAYADTIYVGKDKAYKTVQAAVDATAAMTRDSNQRVTIKVDPGTYREQVIIGTPNITLESNGGTRDNTKITWYYGIGYVYYSAVEGYYDPYADYDQYEKSGVTAWGSSVVTLAAAKGFRAKDITFENSFNKYMTDEEIKDGVEARPSAYTDATITLARKENTNVESKAATERGAAVVNYADQLEFMNCAFIGSQDTLYTGNRAYDSYYKNCYIEGMTDFIYGNGDVIFDGCELNFCGYTDASVNSGYLTAHQGSASYPATDGYIFRNCYISYGSTRTHSPSYLGRMWGDRATVAYINTSLEDADMIVAAGWGSMSGKNPTDAGMKLVEYNTTYNGEKISTSGRAAGAVDTIQADQYTVQKVFIDNGWTPSYYTAETDTVPEFATDPTWGESNGDLNAPNPGETVSVAYALGSDWADNDASKINWYALDADYDSTSLETILESATLLKTSSAVQSKKFQLTMDCAGKYIMAVVTPMTLNGLAGAAKYVINTNSLVSSTWNNPDDAGSIAPGEGINVYLAGDSTVKDYSAAGIYNGGSILAEGSWGEFIQYFFNDQAVTINNYAQGGRASRSFINEGKLDTILANIKEGDYLFVQFGHNDCANDASNYSDRFVPLYTADTKAQTTLGSGGYPTSGFPTIKPTESMKNSSGIYDWNCGATYKGFLQVYIDEALAKGATPVIVTPVARVYYDGGKIKAHHDAPEAKAVSGITEGYGTEGDAYVTACRELYEENIAAGKNVLLLDAFAITKKMYEDAYANGGGANTGYAIMSVKTDGTADYTHNNKTGGVIEAGLIAKELQDMNLSISEYIIQPTKVYGEETNGEYIFTIDKNGVFTAKDKSLTENEYWTEYGQNLFDTIGGGVEPEKEVLLNFTTDEALALYETNAETTFTDGKYSGVYTNATEQEFKVVVYQSAIQYYNSQKQYGTKAPVKTVIFSFTANKAGTYTISTAAGTGSGTLAVYADDACANLLASAAVGSAITYKKAEDGAQTLYFAASAADNLYLASADISYAEPKVVSLTFTDSEVMELYENTDSYVDGVYAGEYTNAAGQKFDVTVYLTGVNTYHNHSPQYGPKANVRVPIFSFTADEAAMYTVATTVGTGSGTLNLYTDAACTNSIASAAAGESIVYKKKSETTETLYLAPSSVNNLYVGTASIAKADLPEDVKVVISGEVQNVEATDSNVELTFKGATETKSISVEKYASVGVELIADETYEISAKGDKGFYIADSITPAEGDATKQTNIYLNRLGFAFPLDFTQYYDEYSTFLSAMGYSATVDVTDVFSGVTIHPSAVDLSLKPEQYGAKTNAYDMISFKAEKSGTVTVTISGVNTAGNTFVLKVNGVGNDEDAVAMDGSDAAPTATVKKGDTVTLRTPTRNNLYYQMISVSYEEDPDAEEPETASINFDLNYTDAPAKDAMTVNVGGLVYAGEIVNPSRTGYTFGGWLKGESAASFPLTVTEDITLIAKWNMNAYTVAFDANCDNATGEMANESFSYDVSKKLSANEYVRAGYDFAGWSLVAAPAESDKIYEDEEAVSRLTDEKDGTVTLYAQWTAATYTVTFDKNGGTGDGMDAMSVTYGEAAKKLTKNTFTNGTKRFMGWADSTEKAAAGDVDYIDEAEVSNLTADLTLYAVWKDVYTVTFNSRGGTEVEAQNIVSGGTVTKPADPTNGTLVFAGWYTTDGEDDKNAYVFTTPVTKSFTLYAKWTEKKEARTIWLVGDSTVCEYVVDDATKTNNTDANYFYRRYGYGMMLGNYFDEDITIQNLAISGRSSKSFLKEANYTTLKNGIKEGDVLIIGFGHNDEKYDDDDRFTNPNGTYETEGSFAKSLYDNYVLLAKNAKATPILCTPIVRRPTDGINFSDSNLHKLTDAKVPEEKRGDYVKAITDLGEQQGIAVVNMTSLTKEVYEDLGKTNNAYLHAWTKAGTVGEDGTGTFIDGTHTNSWGASYNAYLLAKAIYDNNYADLKDRVRNVEAAPTKEEALIENLQYKEVTYTAPTTTSALWSDVGVWHGTVFGDVGGKVTEENFTLEGLSDGSIHIKAATGKGKIGSDKNGIAMYYYAVPTKKNFTLTAKVTVNSNTGDTQSAFGLTAQDGVLIDTNDADFLPDFVAAGVVDTSSTSTNVRANFKRQGGALDKKRTSAVKSADLVGSTYDLALSFQDEGFKCTFGEESVSGGFDFELASIDDKYVYVGMFATRGIDVTFSDITLIVDGEVIAGETPAPLSNDHTVTFVSNGGSAVAAQTVSDGDVATEPAKPAKENAEFDGWYTTADFAEGSEYDFSSKVTKDITLYAKWLNVYTFTFVTNGGTAVDDQKIIEGQKADAQKARSTKKGYVLEGWYADPELTKKYNFDTPVDGNLILYANWVEKPTEVEDGSLKAQFVLENEAGAGYENCEFVTEVTDENGTYYEHVYTGAKIVPAIVVTNGTKILTEGVDYTVKFSNNVNVDKSGKPAVVTITGKGNYTGKDELNFFVTKKSLEDTDVYVGSTRIVADTKAAPVLTYNGLKLAAKDYELQTVNSDGEASGTVAGKIAMPAEGNTVTLMAVAKADGNYIGEKAITIEVFTKAEAKTELKKFKVELAKDVNKKFYYDGTEKTLTVTTADEAGDLTVYDAADKSKATLLEESEDGTDDGFLVSYSANVNAGTVKVTIIGCGEYIGTVTKSFKILPNKSADMTAVLEQENDVVAGDALYDHFTFRKAGVTPRVTVTAKFENADGVKVEKDLTEGVDFKVSYANNKKVSNANSFANYTVTFLGNYKGTQAKKKVAFTIDQAAFIADDMKVTVSHMPCANTGKPQKAAKYLQVPYVELNGELLAKNEYNVVYKVKDADGNFTQEITKKDVLTAPTDEEHPVEIQVVVTPKSANYKKAEGEEIAAEYNVYYTNKVDISKAKITLKSRIDNKGNKTDNGKKVSKVYYTGSEIRFDPTDATRQADLVVTINKKDYVGEDVYKYFNVEYVNNVNKGKATVIITAKEKLDDDKDGTFTGSKAGTFTIAPVNLKIWKVWLESLEKILQG